MTRQRILLISFIGILIFSLLLGGTFVYQKKFVDVSLSRQSQQIPGVTAAKTIENNGQKEMVVTTKHLTDLRKTSQALEKLAGDIPIRIQLDDWRWCRWRSGFAVAPALRHLQAIDEGEVSAVLDGGNVELA